MLVTEFSGCLHVLKCNVQALPTANGGRGILDLPLCHLPRLFRRPVPRSQFTWCPFLSLRPHALAFTVPSEWLGHRSHLSGTCCPPQALRQGRSPARASGRPSVMITFGRVRWPERAFTWPLCHQNSAIISRKQGGHSASWKRRQRQNSWILIPRLCGLTKVSLSSSGKWDIS